ncbi:acetyltransferase domain-containing protein [Xylaria bambusicola]|uniref:acetyltransferase domain-containing protein n=1 Tax=Xylaria bambusicola TaxID=326684 RepID=UPI00200896E5|nr:acetyltransferase domain-containing protein [Xylaria bambusicola]KAI0505779.1 acetyltransferase domain-containing protein [Xylaria bambusicola]
MASPNSSAPPPPAPSKVQVKTTGPVVVPPNINRLPIVTERLLLRPFDISDAEAVHVLRTQPEVMQWTAVGTADKDMDESRTWLQRYLPPNDLQAYNFVIVDRGDGTNGDTAGELVGVGGVHHTRNGSGWPECGYMLRKEYWGKGLATEFLRAFTKAWWALPREEIRVEVNEETVGGRGEKNDSGELQVPEILMAVIEASNVGSRRVLEKSGFREYKQWTEPDSRVGYEGSTATLVALLLEKAPDS